MASERLIVYILRSVSHPARYYTGVTSDVQLRLDTHNRGGSVYTASLRAWHLVAAIELSNETCAAQFEQYLKTGSGRAFAKRHFW